MEKEPLAPKQVAFQNTTNPKAEFDFVPLERLQRLENLDHSPFNTHLVEFYIILYIKSGKGFHTIDFTTYSYEPGTLLTVRKDQLQKFHLNPEVDGEMMVFTEEFLVSYLELIEAQKAIQLFNDVISSPCLSLKERDQVAVSGIIDRINKEYYANHDEYSLRIIRSELQILIARLSRLKSQHATAFKDRKYLGQFLDFQKLIETHITEKKSVQQYARMMGVSSKTLNNVTNSIVNKSAKAFIDEICILRAKRLLINTNQAVKEIAYAMGFQETTNFYKYFKRHTRLTPKQFRGQMK